MQWYRKRSIWDFRWNRQSTVPHIHHVSGCIFYDRGAIAPGKLADFMLLKDPSVLKPEAVFKNGVSIYVKGEPQLPLSASTYEFPADFYRSVQLPEIFLKDFQVNAPFQEG